MADKDIEIGIRTTDGDTTAAEAVEDAIKDVGDATEDTRKKSRAATEEADLATKKAAAAAGKRAAFITAAGTAIAVGAKIAVSELQRVAAALESVNSADLSKLDASLGKNVESLQKWARAAQNPLAALGDFLRGTNLEDEFAGLNKQIELSLKQREGFVDRLLNRGIQTAQQVEAVVRRLSEANALLDAKQSADSAVGQRGDARAVAAGASPNVVAAGRTVTDAVAEVESLERNVGELKTAAEEANKNAAQAKSNLELLKQEDGSQEELAKAAEALKKAEAAAQELAAQANAQGDRLDEKRREIEANAAAKIDELAIGAGAPITKAAEAAISEIEALAAAQGGKLSGLAGDVLQKLYNLVRDNIPDSEQAAALGALLETFRNTTEANNDKVFGEFTRLQGIAMKALGQIDQIKARNNELEARLANMNRR